MNDATATPAAAALLVDDAGPDAPVLAMVHGASQDRRAFEAQIPEFSARFRLLLVELAGHGASAGIPGPYDPETQFAAVTGALDAHGVGQCHFWGTHTGAGVGFMIAANAPQRLRSLVLEGAVLPDRVLPSVARMTAQCRDVAAREGLAAARDHWFDTSPWFEVMRASPTACRAAAHRRMVEDFNGCLFLDRAATRVPRFDLQAVITNDIPTLLVNGENDVPDFLDLARDLARRLPRARRVEIPGGGGFPLWEYPEAVNPVVMDFLTGIQEHPAAR